MLNFSMSELVMILAVVLLVFGPAKVPELGKALGKSIREFKNTTGGIKDDIHKAVSLDTPPEKNQGK